MGSGDARRETVEASKPPASNSTGQARTRPGRRRQNQKNPRLPRLVLGPLPVPPVRVKTVGPPELGHGRATGIDRRSSESLHRGRLPIEGRLDLHGMTQAAAAERLAAFIERAEAAGKRCYW